MDVCISAHICDGCGLFSTQAEEICPELCAKLAASQANIPASQEMLHPPPPTFPYNRSRVRKDAERTNQPVAGNMPYHLFQLFRILQPSCMHCTSQICCSLDALRDSFSHLSLSLTAQQTLFLPCCFPSPPACPSTSQQHDSYALHLPSIPKSRSWPAARICNLYINHYLTPGTVLTSRKGGFIDKHATDAPSFHPERKFP